MAILILAFRQYNKLRKEQRPVNLSNQLKTARQKKRLTQRQVAETIHVDTTTYAHYELGRRVPNAKIWVELCRVLEIPVFPAQIQVIYPDGLLDKFEKCIVDNGKPTESFRENNERLMRIENTLNEVYKIQEDAMDTTHLPINKSADLLSSGSFTIMNVALDVRGEKLIRKALKCMSALIAKNHAICSK